MFAATRCRRNGPNARRSRYRQPAQQALTGRVSPGRPSANLKDASLNPIKTFLVATTFAHHCPGPSSTATLARYRALPSGSSTTATTVSRGAVPACATHWTKTCGRSCGRRCCVGRRTPALTRSPCARWEADTPRCRARGCRPQWPPNGRAWGGSFRSSTLAGRACSPSRPARCSFPTSMLPLLLVLVAGDTTGYWQQQVAYRITATLDEPSGVLTGHVRISYVNRSPDTLRDFYVHQYLNAFRPGSRWAAAASAE